MYERCLMREAKADLFAEQTPTPAVAHEKTEEATKDA